jgi:hypothetical protein
MKTKTVEFTDEVFNTHLTAFRSEINKALTPSRNFLIVKTAIQNFIVTAPLTFIQLDLIMDVYVECCEYLSY